MRIPRQCVQRRQLVIQAPPGKADADNHRRIDQAQRLFKIRAVLFGNVMHTVRRHLRQYLRRDRVEIPDHRRQVDPGLQRQHRPAIRRDTARGQL
tara:strand:- start:8526 stop:8810 length:285 start_codon:yes stop_codon:yes gene_type:complete